MIYYKLKNKITGLYVYSYRWVPGNFSELVYDKDGEFLSLKEIKIIIEVMIEKRSKTALENLEVEAFKTVKHTTSLQIKTLIERVEEKMVFKKLKNSA